MYFNSKALIAGLITAALAGASLAAAPTVTSTDGNTVVGGIAAATVTIQFDANAVLDSGGFLLDWDSTALTLMPASSSINGNTFAQVQTWAQSASAEIARMPGYELTEFVTFNYSEPGSAVFSAVMLPVPLDMSSQQVKVSLAFKGLRESLPAFPHPVTYKFETHLAADLNGLGDSVEGTLHIAVSAVPEPATWALWLAGIVMAGSLTRRGTLVR